MPAPFRSRPANAKAALGGGAAEAGTVPEFKQIVLAMIPENIFGAAAAGAMLPMVLFVSVLAVAATRIAEAPRRQLALVFESFAFKHGLPLDADLVFDVRMLPNPHWVKELRLKTGQDAEVKQFLESQPLTEELYLDLLRFLNSWLPRYRDSNRSYMTVAVGCTGGQHRSVYLAERLFQHFNEQLPNIHIRHRELQ